jgi:hypothetical protein
MRRRLTENREPLLNRRRRGLLFSWRWPVATLRVTLTYPPELVRDPVIYTVAKTYRLVPNIRKAKVTESSGEATLDLTGAEEDLKRGIEHLTRLGVKVKPVGTPRSSG